MGGEIDGLSLGEFGIVIKFVGDALHGGDILVDLRGNEFSHERVVFVLIKIAGGGDAGLGRVDDFAAGEVGGVVFFSVDEEGGFLAIVGGGEMVEGVLFEGLAGAQDDVFTIAVVRFFGRESEVEMGLVVAKEPAFFVAAIVLVDAEESTVARALVDAAPGGDGEGVGREVGEGCGGGGSGAVKGEAALGGDDGF